MWMLALKSRHTLPNAMLLAHQQLASATHCCTNVQSGAADSQPNSAAGKIEQRQGQVAANDLMDTGALGPEVWLSFVCCHQHLISCGLPYVRGFDLLT